MSEAKPLDREVEDVFALLDEVSAEWQIVPATKDLIRRLLSTNRGLVSEVEELKAALREAADALISRVVVVRERQTHGGGFAAVGLRCNLCKAEYDFDFSKGGYAATDLKHNPACLTEALRKQLEGK